MLMARFLFVILGLLLTTSTVFAAPPNDPLLIKADGTTYDHASPGNTVPVFYFTLERDQSDIFISTMNVRFHNGQSLFGPSQSEIREVRLYRDDPVNGTVGVWDGDAVEDLVGTVAPSVSTSGVIMNLSQRQDLDADNIPATPSRNFFLVYSFGSSMAVGQAYDYFIEDFEYQGGAGSGFTVSGNATAVSGNTIHLVTANSVVLDNAFVDDDLPLLSPGVVNKPVFRFSLRSVGGTFDFNQLDLTNAIANFDNSLSVDVSGNTIVSNAGVTKAKLYYSSDPIFNINEDVFLSEVNNTGVGGASVSTINSASSVVFSNFTQSQSMGPSEALRYYFVTYDIGVSTNITVPVGQSVSARILNGSVSGLGNLGQAISNATLFPTSSATVTPIAGFTYDSTLIQSLVNTDNFYGSRDTVPMLRFDLFPQNSPVTLNAIRFQNTGGDSNTGLNYRVNGSDESNVSFISLYRDDGDKIFDEGDTLIGSEASAAISASLATINVISPFRIDQGAVETFFLTYGLGDSVTTGRFADARLFSAAGTIRGETIVLTGDLPSSVTPDARFEVRNSTISLLGAQAIGPRTVIKGQENVPVLAAQFAVQNLVTTATVEIANGQASFFETNTGVDKVSLYWDKGSEGTVGVLDDTDELLGAVSSFPSANAVGIPVGFPTDGTTVNMIVTYDVGDNAAVGPSAFSSQITGISPVSGSTVTVGGDFPFPKQVTLNSVVASPVEFNPNVSIGTASVTNDTPQFSVLLAVKNNLTSDAVPVQKVLPRFYAGSINGKEVTHEYTIVPQSHPITLAANATTQFQFLVSPSNILTTDTIVVDGMLVYDVTETAQPGFVLSDSYYSSGQGQTARAVIQRYKGAGNTFVPAVTNVASIAATSTRIETSLDNADYVSNLERRHNGVWASYKNGTGLPSNAGLRFTFKNAGVGIDASSISVIRSDGHVYKIQALSGNSTEYYSYDESTGVLSINDIGAADGSILVTVSDSSGDALPTAELRFFVSNTLRVERFLFYPNPYTPSSSQNLNFGFAIMGADDDTFSAEVHLFDSTGYPVGRYEESNLSQGYVLVDWDTSSTFGGFYISSGVYIAKLIVNSSSGESVSAVTKLSVY